MKIKLALLLTLGVPLPSLAHSVVDVTVRFSAPEFVAAGSTAQVDVLVDALAYDPAIGATLQIVVSEARVASADGAWRCTTGPELIQCSAEELQPGPHPIRLDVRVPTTGSLRARATTDTLGSFDPKTSNNTATLESRVFDRTRCSQSAPQITGDFQWSETEGAVAYDIFYGIDGETPHFLRRTNDTSIPITVTGGDVTWFVRARFDGCPALDSANASFRSMNAPARLAVTTVGQLQRPLSIASDGALVYIADAAAKKIYTVDSTTLSLRPLEIFGDIITDPPSFDGGITIGPGEYLYSADRSTHSVRFADSTRFMFFAAGQARSAGSVDGQGIHARFDAPTAVAVDARGTFFITDAASHVVRRMKYDSTKFDFFVTTLAGTAGQFGFADGRGSAARFRDPAGVALDAAGNLLVADRGNHAIRRVSVDGTVTTIAGTGGLAGHRDGDVTEALFNQPTGIAIDAFGNIYVTEHGNHDVRKIAPNGRVTTVAEGFDQPGQLTVAADGTIWIPDSGNGRVLRAATWDGQKRHAVRR